MKLYNTSSARHKQIALMALRSKTFESSSSILAAFFFISPSKPCLNLVEPAYLKPLMATSQSYSSHQISTPWTWCLNPFTTSCVFFFFLITPSVKWLWFMYHCVGLVTRSMQVKTDIKSEALMALQSLKQVSSFDRRQLCCLRSNDVSSSMTALKLTWNWLGSNGAWID